MKDLHFRAWVKEKQKMRVVSAILGMETNKIVIAFLDENEQFGCGSYHQEDIILMQSTGIKDVNGREIFEGDIFNTPSQIKFFVVFDKGCFFYQNVFDEHPNGLVYEIVRDWEVIGNIYENPELMKRA
jgi:uncharacterized phage protein (TIGR01671 family)